MYLSVIHHVYHFLPSDPIPIDFYILAENWLIPILYHWGIIYKKQLSPMLLVNRLDNYTCLYIAVIHLHIYRTTCCFCARPLFTESLTESVIAWSIFMAVSPTYSTLLISIVTGFFKVIHGDRLFVMVHSTRYAYHHLEKQLNDVMYSIGYGIGHLIHILYWSDITKNGRYW